MNNLPKKYRLWLVLFDVKTMNLNLNGNSNSVLLIPSDQTMPCIFVLFIRRVWNYQRSNQNP
jgi:hypothetical protein